MPDSVLRHRSAPLRLIALRLAVPELESVAREATVIEAYRLTIHYHDARHSDQVATLTRRRNEQTAHLNVAYRKAEKPFAFDFRLPLERVTALAAGLRQLGFDGLDDMPNIPWFGADLWLLERAAGSYHHDLILAPSTATGPYAALAALVSEQLPQAVRALPSI